MPLALELPLEISAVRREAMKQRSLAMYHLLVPWLPPENPLIYHQRTPRRTPRRPPEVPLNRRTPKMTKRRGTPHNYC